MRQQAVIVNNYLTSVVSLYQESSKEKKGEVLDIAELVTQRSRKQLIKRLSRMGSNKWLFFNKATRKASSLL